VAKSRKGLFEAIPGWPLTLLDEDSNFTARLRILGSRISTPESLYASFEFVSLILDSLARLLSVTLSSWAFPARILTPESSLLSFLAYLLSSQLSILMSKFNSWVSKPDPLKYWIDSQVVTLNSGTFRLIFGFSGPTPQYLGSSPEFRSWSPEFSLACFLSFQG